MRSPPTRSTTRGDDSLYRLHDSLYTRAMCDKIPMVLDRLVLDHSEQKGGTIARRHEVLLDTLVRSFLLFYADQDRESMEREVAAFEGMHPELWAKYPHQYVALHQGQIVDRDHDEMALLHRLDDEYRDEVVLVRQVLRQPQGELHYRSPDRNPQRAGWRDRNIELIPIQTIEDSPHPAGARRGKRRGRARPPCTQCAPAPPR
jgi:hypothetical protein